MAIALGALPVLNCRAQTSEAAPTAEVRPFLVFRGGYTGGRFGHSTDDFRSRFNLFGSASTRTGLPVEHRFDGLLLGADFGQEFYRPYRNRTTTITIGLDLLAASDRVRIGTDRTIRLTLGALHPHFEAGFNTKNWQFRGGVGLLLGRVGYYGSTSSGFLSSSTTVDTATVVPTFQTRVGWRNWVLAENGYGASGLLGLANPLWQVGFGTGFGPRSPVAVIVGASMPESVAFDQQENGFGYLRLEVTPATSPWRANGFLTFGTGSYNRVALQASYRLPLPKKEAAVTPHR
ncbi:hypothetical protein [Hymenobacter negativus]|uniref:Outer membrane protein beta-barrel domain-containing protein n=1 Tax=Hymenobacter negativus TaxID=2795026 RepID=A0ABS3QCF1_9BACT|nr:hypothetical protein [Hymenobacter negativus]MBO2008881.1 hypothetical protein [Hymenobacter negativus]